MKKLLISAAAFLTSFSLFTGIIPFSGIAYAVNTESGVLDVSDISLEFGELDTMSLNLENVPKILAEGDGYRLGDCLDANNSAVYAAFEKLVEPTLDEFTVTLPETVTFSTDDLNSSENQDFYNAVFGNCASGMEAASFDTPWIFWLDNNKTSVSAGNMRYTYNRFTKLYTFTIENLTFKPAAYDGFSSFEEIGEYKLKLQEAVENYPVEGETTAEKLKSIHDQICCFTDYNVEGKFSGSALSALVEPGAVCEGYSKGFKMLCDSIGIPAICVFGNFNETDATAHMWNYVRMDDGLWYAVDVTWDDYDGDYGFDFVDKYFLKGSADFNVKHSPCNDYNLTHLEYPELAEHNYGSAPESTTSSSKTTTKTTTKTTATTASEKISTATKTSIKTTKKTTTKTSTKTTKKTTTKTTTATTTAATVPPEEFEYGDLNHDGKVSIADLVYCASNVLGIEKTKYSCDVNGDGFEDVYDVVIMRKLVVAKVREKSLIWRS